MKNSKVVKIGILGAYIGLTFFAASTYAKQTKHALVKCSLATKNYVQLLKESEEYLNSEIVIDDRICDQPDQDCSRIEVPIAPLGSRYSLQVYLTSEAGKKITANISIDKSGYSQVGRDLKKDGFLTAVIENQFVMIGCALSK